jgi:hypothetical protein
MSDGCRPAGEPAGLVSSLLFCFWFFGLLSANLTVQDVKYTKFFDSGAGIDYTVDGWPDNRPGGAISGGVQHRRCIPPHRHSRRHAHVPGIARWSHEWRPPLPGPMPQTSFRQFCIRAMEADVVADAFA